MLGLLKIATRNLSRNLRRTLITATAIAGGLSLLVWSDTLAQGTYKGLIQRGVSELAGHVVVQAEGYQDDPDMHLLVPDLEAVEATVRSVGGPEARVTSRVQVQGLLQSTKNVSGVALLGIDPVAEATVSTWHTKLVTDGDDPGAWLEPSDDRGIVLGIKLAEALEVEVGDKVVLMLQGRDEVVNQLFRVRGLLRTGEDNVDGFMALTTVAAAQAALERPDSATMVTVHLDDPADVPAVRDALEAALAGAPVEVLPWQEALPEMYQFTVLDRQSQRAIFFVMAVIVAMGVLNTVLMSVMERIKEFGVMLALGTTPSQVFRVIVLEGIVLGFFAMLAGGALGVLATAPTITYGIDYGAWMGDNMEVAGVTMDSQVYAAWNWPGTFSFCICAWLMTIFASLWPAWRASRLAPVEAMRHV
jgi:ABC-type lipoprotein release transport system permease subunit